LGTFFLLLTLYLNPKLSAESSPAAPPEPWGPPEPWESLSDIVALRAGGKWYHLIGGLTVASPYLEVSTIIFAVTTIAASFSPLTSPFYFLFLRRGV
jgi:hypothetical protein